MKFTAVAIAIALAAPMAAAVPAPADAQVLAGRGGDTRRLRSAPRPALSEREEARLFAAEDAVFELTQQIEELEAVAEPTAAQSASLENLRERLNDEQATVDRLQAKRDRRG
ncbi:hypothetical protein ACETK8_08975 [Brevundimonas staleyi]|uniref:YbgF trimerisation domain-containing protein n=1 Tax=Brevundimonas staleyi TaxID=74326 RepID=A0ABW0FNP5_9CAUL